MNINKRKLVNTTIGMIMIFNTIPYANAASGTRINIENPNYKLQKYEPKEGTYLGTYILQDKRVTGTTGVIEEEKSNHLNYINIFQQSVANTGGMGKHASYFKYIGYGHEHRLQPLYNWIDAVFEADAIPHIALEPNDKTDANGNVIKGLDLVKKDDYLINLAKKLGSYNKPIFLRYASEMNGNWTDYYGNPTKYKEKWRIVHDVMEQYAPNVIMTWVPNDEPISLIDSYYPGDNYVDWVGVNTYHVMYSNGKDVRKQSQLDKIDYVYNKYGHKKPLFIGEYGTAHHTTVDNNKDNTSYAIKNIQELYKRIEADYPRIKAVFYFNVNTQEDTSIPEANRKKNNYSLTDGSYGQKFSTAYKNITSSNHFIKSGSQAINSQGSSDSELINLQLGIKTKNNKKYIAVTDVTSALGGSANIKSNTVELSILNKKSSFKINGVEAYKSGNYHYISIDKFCQLFNYKLITNPKQSNSYILDYINNNNNNTPSKPTQPTQPSESSQPIGERKVTVTTSIYSSQGSNKIGTVSKNSIVDLYSAEGNWALVKDKTTGIKGYVSRSYLAYVSTTTQEAAPIGQRKIKTTTSIYSSQGSNKIGTVSQGRIVDLYSAEGNWALVKDKTTGLKGYVSRTCLTYV